MATDYTNGLRQLANYLDERPELVGRGLAIDHFPSLENEENPLAVLRRWAELLGPFHERETVGSFVVLRRTFGPHRIEINFKRWEVPVDDS